MNAVVKETTSNLQKFDFLFNNIKSEEKRKVVSQIKVGYSEITPAIAKELLNFNDNNRKLKRYHLRYIEDQMTNNEWEITGEAIQISDTGRLIDGQSRLNGIIVSGKPQVLLLVVGVPDRSQAVIDSGKSRSAGDVLHMNGVHNTTITAAGIKTFQRLSNDIKSYGGDKKYISTNKRVLEYYKDNPELLQKVVLFAQACYKDSERHIGAGHLAGLYLHFLDAANGDTQAVESFLKKVTIGTNVSIDSTIHTLRLKLRKASLAKERITHEHLNYYIILTWNYEQEGKYVKKLMAPSKVDLSKLKIVPLSKK